MQRSQSNAGGVMDTTVTERWLPMARRRNSSPRRAGSILSVRDNGGDPDTVCGRAVRFGGHPFRPHWCSRVASVLLLIFVSAAALAQTEAKAPFKADRGFFALPIELDLDSGAANGDASILRILPVYTFPVFDKWKLVNLDIITLADAPGGTPAFPGDPSQSSNKAGLSDLLHASFYTPDTSGQFIWGVGINMSLPTATDESLGSGKWAAGPAIRLTYRSGPWNFGAIAGQRWSFAGSSNRSDVNQLLIRGAIRRRLNDDWYLVSAPIITANWDLAGEKWLIPVGGGIGRRFSFGGYPWAWSAQGYYNAIKPDPAPDWVIRFGLTAAFPFGQR